MAPARNTLGRMSSRIGLGFSRKALQRDAVDDSDPNKPLLPGRPIDDDYSDDAGPSTRRLSQSSTIRAKSGPDLSGSTLVSRNQPTVTPEMQTPVSTRDTVQPSELALRLRYPTNEDHSDAITPAPPRRTESDFSQAPTAIMVRDAEGKPAMCFICGMFFGKGKGQTREKLAYLPCGHSFGHKCLFRFMSKPNGAGNCPQIPCIAMRHACEHLTMPRTTPPAETFHDNHVAVLPWNYEFCSSPKGSRYLRTITSSGTKVRRLESQRRNRKKSVLDFTVATQLKYYTTFLEKTEKRLDEAQRIYWNNRWSEFEKKKKKKKRTRSWSWRSIRGGTRVDSDSATS